MRRFAPLILLIAGCPILGCAGPPGASEGVTALAGVPPTRVLGELVTDHDVEHYTIELAVDPEQGQVRGRCTVRFFPLVEGLGSLNLDLVGLTASAVRDRDGAALEFAQFEGKLRVVLPAGLRRGQGFEVVVDYTGQPRTGLWFGRQQCSAGGALEGARGWFPCQDHPADLATVELLLDLPEAWTGVAGAERIEARARDGRRLERWRFHVPHAPFRVGFVAGEGASVPAEAAPFVLGLQQPAQGVGGDTGIGTEGFVNLPQPFPDLELAVRAVEFLSTLTGRRYPYPVLAVGALEGRPAGHGGPLGVVPLGSEGSEGLVRGIAAQWFGGLVNAADWSEVWLHAGLAELAAQRWLELEQGDEAAQLARAVGTDRAIAVQERRPRALVHGTCREPGDLFEPDLLASVGAARLQLLRYLLGDDAFFAGLRRFVAEAAGRPTRTRELLTALAGERAEELLVWFERPGSPALELSWTHDAGRGRILLTVNQVHEVTDGVPPVFELPLDLELGLEEGVERRRIQLTARRELFELPVPTAPRWVLADPEAWLPVAITSRKSLAEWRAIALEADVVGRRRAVRALGRSTRAAEGEERALSLDLLAGRLAGDASAVVRAEAARSLGVVGGERARDVLTAAAVEDVEPAVRALALTSLCAVGEDAELASLGRARYGEGSSEERSAAALLVACSDPEGALPWLEGLLESPPPARWERDASLLPALARVGPAAAAAQAESLAFDEVVSAGDRAQAARLLGGLLPERPELLGRLGELLKVGVPEVQDAVVDALASTASEGARRLLIAFYPLTTTAHQRRRIEEAVGG